MSKSSKSPFVKKDTVGQKIHRVKESTKPWLFRYARFGHMSKGVVYLIIGILALLTAFGLNGKLASSQGALYTIAQKPLGFVLLIVLAVGLSGYSCWQIILTLFGPGGNRGKLKETFSRVGYLVISACYIGICVSALKILFRADVQSSDKKYEALSAKLLGEPFGQLIIALAGGGFIIAGIITIYWALSGRFQKRLKKNEMTHKEWQGGGIMGKFGISARGLVFGIIGFFLIRTAIQADPNETKGLDGALAELAQQPFGPILLAIVSFGLIAYGVYMFAEARYKRLDP